MEVISKREVVKFAHLNYVGGEKLAEWLMNALKINQLNTIYSSHYQKTNQEFLSAVLQDLSISYSIKDAELKYIPQEGAFIMVANFPSGTIEGLILLNALLKIRPDIKVMNNFVFKRLEPLKNQIIDFPLNCSKRKVKKYSEIDKHLADGHPIILFPAVKALRHLSVEGDSLDRKWNKQVVHYIRKAKQPIIPVHLSGKNSALFHWLEILHPSLGKAKLPSEIINKKNKNITIQIGEPILQQEQDLFKRDAIFGRYLRIKLYALNTHTDVKSFFKPRKKLKIEEVAQPIEPNQLQKELKSIATEKLFDIKNYEVYAVQGFKIPLLMQELGRLREITFREIGEGTNNSIDIDEYDLYYHQLFIWDKEANAIVGGYRIGVGSEVLRQMGVKGFYTQTLFKIHKSTRSMFEQSMELGRSFIAKDYQRKPLSLFLLWKGILYFLLKNRDCRYLVGPVSISDSFSLISQQLMVDYIKQNHFHQTLSKLILPRKPFTPKLSENESLHLLKEMTNIQELENVISKLESNKKRVPVLLKKYLHMGGKIACFNVDPLFNNSLDGFLILDLADVPQEVIESLAKEMNDDQIAERFDYGGKKE